MKAKYQHVLEASRLFEPDAIQDAEIQEAKSRGEARRREAERERLEAMTGDELRHEGRLMLDLVTAEPRTVAFAGGMTDAQKAKLILEAILQELAARATR